MVVIVRTRLCERRRKEKEGSEAKWQILGANGKVFANRASLAVDYLRRV